MILVTGGAGYIGSHCALALLEKGNDIVIFDRNKAAILKSRLALRLESPKRGTASPRLERLRLARTFQFPITRQRKFFQFQSLRFRGAWSI